MPTIHVLDKQMAQLIAAGEVVERPAAIVKELVENSIDAGATAISVEIKSGGSQLIRISDNGCGISRDDIPKAFMRHATSKVRCENDLDGIATLGFRGEALASVAAMCRVQLTSKTIEEEEGSTYQIEGGELIDFFPDAHPVGTTITVKDVFFNTPARMKFLKKDLSEGNSVQNIMDKCALSHPEIAFKFIRDGQVKLQTSGNGETLSAIYTVYGRELAAQMTAVDYTSENGIHVSGHVCKPQGAKASRAFQSFFINGRYVRTNTATAALEQAFRGKLMTGKFPACVLHIEIDAGQVDVNVHPAKIEVRFVQEKPVFNAVYFAVKSALEKLEVSVFAPVEQAEKPTEIIPIQSEKTTAKADWCTRLYAAQSASAQQFKQIYSPSESAGNFFSKPLQLHASKIDITVDSGGYLKQQPKDIQAATAVLERPQPKLPEPPEQFVIEKQPQYRLIGELFGTYILVQRENSLLLVDKHAVHERILYEQIKENAKCKNRQLLLTPQTITLDILCHGALTQNLDILEDIGFLVEDFGGVTIIVREIPLVLFGADVEQTLCEIANSIQKNHQDITPAVLDKLLFSVACKSAVRARDKSTLPELNTLLEALDKNPKITHCPHGRPVSVAVTKSEIEKMFGRLV